ncbi:unnamed protein product, partial [Rotaria magnacalcarata]
FGCRKKFVVWMAKEICEMDKTNSSLVLIQLIDCFFYLGLDIERNSRYAENKFVVSLIQSIN